MTSSWDDSAAELFALEAVAAVGLGLCITQSVHMRGGERAACWTATTQISHVQYDGRWAFELPAGDPDHDRDPVTGYGETRLAALADLHRALQRVTAGQMSRIAWSDRARARSVILVPVAWDGHRIAEISRPRSWPAAS